MLETNFLLSFFSIKAHKKRFDLNKKFKQFNNLKQI